ncbi:MAG TPA: hypothetical protein VGG75_13655 [Trebonia sp.]
MKSSTVNTLGVAAGLLIAAGVTVPVCLSLTSGSSTPPPVNSSSRRAAPLPPPPPAPSVRPLNGATDMRDIQWTKIPDSPYQSGGTVVYITSFCYAGVQFYVTESGAGSVSTTTAVQNGGSTGEC